MPRIALFPGHTGKDTGALDPAGGPCDVTHTVEAAVTLTVAHKVATALELMGMQYAILMGSFDARISMSAGCVCGVSIHADVCTDERVRGHHVIHYPRSVAGRALAVSIDESLSVMGPRARKVHADGSLAILRETGFPCALVELGFLSNQTEEAELLNHHYQHRMAFAIVDGLRRWLAVG